MTTRLPSRIVAVLGICASCASALPAGADQPPLTGGEFRVRRATIDGGGGESSGGPFTVRGTIGQPDAATASGGGFRLRGGFWSSPGEITEVLFEDGFEL